MRTQQDIPERLRAIKEARHWTWDELAGALDGISKSAIDSYLCGRRNPSPRIMRRLLEVEGEKSALDQVKEEIHSLRQTVESLLQKDAERASLDRVVGSTVEHEGGRFKAPGRQPRSVADQSVPGSRIGDTLLIPVLSPTALTGIPPVLDMEQSESNLQLPESLLSKSPDCYAAIRFSAEEAPSPRGAATLIIIDRSTRNLSKLRGRTVVFQHDGRMYMGRLDAKSTSQRMLFSADIPSRGPMEIDRPRSNPILGDVVIVWNPQA